MKKNICKILIVITLFFTATKNVFGDQKYTLISEMKDENGQKIYRNSNGNSERQLSIEIKSYDGEPALNGYCLDVGLTLSDQIYIGTLDVNLKGYLNKILNNENNADKISKKINEYIHFGYQYNGQNSYKYLLATQKLIWDELYNAGYRQNSYSNNTYFTAGGNTIDISTEINNIKNNISNYYKTPSMCSSNTKLEIAIGETMSYEDSANVLSNYKVNCDNELTCKIEGNTLKITASSEGVGHNITFTKEGIGNNSSVIYQRSNEQAILVNADPIEGVSCQFGVDTYKNVQTSGAKLAYVIVLGLFSGVIAYIAYCTNKS